jgi:hypothetical protein
LKKNSVIAPFLEQRLKPRIECNYAAMIQGQDGSGKKFKEKGRVVNISRSGIFLITNQAIPECYEVSIQIALPTGVLEYGSSKLAMTGTVVWRELCLDGNFGVAIKFQNFRFL